MRRPDAARGGLAAGTRLPEMAGMRARLLPYSSNRRGAGTSPVWNSLENPIDCFAAALLSPHKGRSAYPVCLGKFSEHLGSDIVAVECRCGTGIRFGLDERLDDLFR